MNKLIGLCICFLSGFSFTQESTADRPLFLSTEFNISFHHLGGYSKERSAIYLEQGLHYQFDNEVAIGGTIGINAYPGLLALPIGLSAQLPILRSLNRDWFVTQSLSRNIKVGTFFYRGNRYRGGINLRLKTGDRLLIHPEIGYSFIWDRYGGAALSFLAGVRLCY